MVLRILDVSISVIQFAVFVQFINTFHPHNSIPVKKETYTQFNIPDTFTAFCSVTQ